jgi:hypothetical protein
MVTSIAKRMPRLAVGQGIRQDRASWGKAEAKGFVGALWLAQISRRKQQCMLRHYT